MPWGHPSGEGGREGPQHGGGIHDKVDIHSTGTGDGGSGVLRGAQRRAGVGVRDTATPTVMCLIRHWDVPIKRAHSSIRYKGAVRIFWGFHLHFCLFRLSLVLHPAILEPSLHLHVRELEFLCQLPPLS